MLVVIERSRPNSGGERYVLGCTAKISKGRTVLSVPRGALSPKSSSPPKASSLVADCKPLDLFLVIIRPHAPSSIVSQLSPARRCRTRVRIIFASSLLVNAISSSPDFEFHPRFEIQVLQPVVLIYTF